MCHRNDNDQHCTWKKCKKMCLHHDLVYHQHPPYHHQYPPPPSSSSSYRNREKAIQCWRSHFGLTASHCYRVTLTDQCSPLMMMMIIIIIIMLVTSSWSRSWNEKCGRSWLEKWQMGYNSTWWQEGSIEERARQFERYREQILWQDDSRTAARWLLQVSQLFFLESTLCDRMIGWVDYSREVDDCPSFSALSLLELDRQLSIKCWWQG